MEKNQAQAIVRDTFEKSFDKSTFTQFIKHLLNFIEEAPFSHKGNLIPDAYEQHISLFERIAKYADGEQRIDILVVKLKKEASIERARTMQRNFVARYLNGSRGGELKDAALVAFVAPDNQDWRFSLVKMDYRFEDGKEGKVKVKEEFTPARRWSFLVGANEKSHTAQSQLVPIIIDDQRNPTLKDLEEAFNIEKATREFFEKYRDLFLCTKEELDDVLLKYPKVKADFEAKCVDTVNFAKKLLGQIVFLYFLQKKGWFGVQRDAPWGTGSKHFLRELFERKHCEYSNFFNDVLEPLFYEALRRDRSDEDHYFSHFNCKIPFLNGGLFDPIKDYDWVHTDILLPNQLFSNANKTKEGDTGNGILDIFDRYNFTVKEDEPLEKEVAIDPELLGKAYEKFNAIRPDNYDEYKEALDTGKKGAENKFNKQYGVYYTPREIVHYMCQQSLINYLDAELNAKSTSYEKMGGQNLDILGNAPKKGQLDFTTEHKSRSLIPKEDIEILIEYGEQVGENEARVVAEGRETETYYHKLPEGIRKAAKLLDDLLANLRVCDPAVGSGAFLVGMMTEIVKARNVLTAYLIAPDKGGSRGIRIIYHFKRECIEKSLYGVDIDPGAVEIAKLRLWLSLVVDEEEIRRIKPLPNLDYKVVCGNSLLAFPGGLVKNVEIEHQIEQLKPRYFSETNIPAKRALKTEIDAKFKRLVEEAQQYSDRAKGVTFDFAVHFSEVFHKKGGFDVVIANPPYNELRDLELDMQNVYKDSEYYKHAIGGRVNLFQFFYPLAIRISKKPGIICLITQNSILAEDSALQNRKFILANSVIIRFISFPERDDTKKRVFENAKMSVCIGILKVTETIPDDYSCEIVVWYDRHLKCGHVLRLSLSEIKSIYPQKLIFPMSTGGSFEILKKILKKRSVYYVNSKSGEIDMTKYGRKFNLSRKGYRVYTGSQILRYRTTDEPSQGRVIYLDINLSELSPNKRRDLSDERIAMQRITGVDSRIRLIMTIIPRNTLCANSTNYITAHDKNDLDLRYILALLNSTLINYYFKQTSTNTNIVTSEINTIPIPRASKSLLKHLSSLVKRILAISNDEDYLLKPPMQPKVKALQRRIDQLVYKLYGLTPEEIAIVEQETGAAAHSDPQQRRR